MGQGLTRVEWTRHIIENHPELADFLKSLHQEFGAVVTKLEHATDPQACWGTELPWQTDHSIKPYLGRTGPIGKKRGR